MTRTPQGDGANRPPISADGRENDSPRFRVELESPDRGVRHVRFIHADSMEEALVKVREVQPPGESPGGDSGTLRVVEASEENSFTEDRHQRNARRRYINTIVESGLRALGQDAPARSDEAFFDVFCDFFSRTIVRPGHYAFPSEGPESDRLLKADDATTVMAQLLLTHLAHHDVTLTRIRPE
ncbi:hypothetical protein ACH4D3_33195 [Streptomyces sp. NPDC018026]|uniref:hypothetical protein n=1 Tax=Streptomyces sp. NPDC018026 TaxID=3365031 RepID=UPI00378F8483